MQPIQNPDIVLPRRIPCNIFQASGRYTDERDGHMWAIVDNLIAYLSNRFTCWEKVEDFRFELPKSLFDHQRDIPTIEFVKPQLEEDRVLIQPLNQEQLASIEKDGTFVTLTEKHSLKSEWKVNTLIHKGREIVAKERDRALGYAFSHIYEIGERFTGDSDFSFKSCKEAMTMYSLKLVNALVGLKKTRTHPTKTIVQVAQARKHRDFLNKYREQLRLSLFQYLSLDLSVEEPEATAKINLEKNERVNKLRQACSTVGTKWGEKLEDYIDDLLEKTDNSEEIRLTVIKEQQRMMVDQLRNCGVPENITIQIFFYVSVLTILTKLSSQKDSLTATSLQKLQQELKAKYTVRSHCDKFYNEKYTQGVDKLQGVHHQSFLDNMRRQVPLPFIEDQVRYMQNRPEIERDLNMTYSKTEPHRIFTFWKSNYPKYEVVYDPAPNTYRFSNRQKQEVDTSGHFWLIRCMLALTIQIATYSVKNLFTSLWNGNFGLRVLLETRVFYPVYQLNPRTGELGRSGDHHNTRVPIWQDIKRSIAEVGTTRDEFENSADTGFLKKSYSRIFNILYCYLVLLVGKVFLYLCFVKIILILLWVILLAVLVMTIWLWAPLLVFFYYLFTIFVYNSYVQKWFPIFNFIFRTLVCIFVLVINCLGIILWHPLVSLVVTFYAIICFCMRSCYDCFTFKLIRALGRCPAKESFVAKRLKQQHRAGTSVMTLKHSDIKILLLAEIEKIHLDIFRNKVTSKINQPMQEMQAVFSRLSSRLLGSFHTSNKVSESCHYYTRRLDQQITERTKHYPVVPNYVNIRFTEEDMQTYSTLSREILQEFMDDYPDVDLFAHFKVRHGKIHKVVMKLWKRIFRGSTRNVFNPLQGGDLVTYANQQRLDDQMQLLDMAMTQRMMQREMDDEEERGGSNQLMRSESRGSAGGYVPIELPYKWDDEELYLKYRTAQIVTDLYNLINIVTYSTTAYLQDTNSNVTWLFVVHPWIQAVIKLNQLN